MVGFGEAMLRGVGMEGWNVSFMRGWLVRVGFHAEEEEPVSSEEVEELLEDESLLLLPGSLELLEEGLPEELPLWPEPLLTAMPPDSAWATSGVTPESSGLPASGADFKNAIRSSGWASERSATITPTTNRRHRLVAKAPITPGLASNKCRRFTSHGA